MSYLQDRKTKRRKISHVLFFTALLLAVFYLRSGIWSGLSTMSQAVFRPVIVLGGSIGERFGSLGSYFASKSSLSAENKNLKRELDESRAGIANYNSILAENISLKETLERKDVSTPLVLAAILSKPNQSAYDTLLIDQGEAQGLKTGDIVFARGNVPVGKISSVYPNSSKVVLFSTSGEKTQVVAGDRNIFLEAVGRGGGNFEVIMSREFTLVKGDEGARIDGAVADVLAYEAAMTMPAPPAA